MKAKIKCVIDIGNTEIRGIVGEYSPKNDEYKIIAAASVESDGIDNGKIVNLQALSNRVKECIEKLSEQMDIVILSVDVVINAKEVVYYKKSAKIMFYDKSGKPISRKVTLEDVNRVVEKIKKENFKSDKVLVDTLISSFILDEGDKVEKAGDEAKDIEEDSGIESPIGMFCGNLKAYVILAFMDFPKYENIRTVFKNIDIEVKNLILQPIAFSKFLLSKDDKKYGTLLFHVGDCSSDFVFWYRGKIKCIENMGVGGRHFTYDLMSKFKIETLKHAEEIKINQVALSDDKTGEKSLIINDDHSRGFDKKVIFRDVMISRAEDLFEKLKGGFVCPEFKRELKFIVLAGEASKIKGFDKLLENEFGVVVRRNEWVKSKVKFESDVGIPSKFYSSIGALGYSVERELMGESVINSSLSTNFLNNFFKKIKFWR